MSIEKTTGKTIDQTIKKPGEQTLGQITGQTSDKTIEPKTEQTKVGLICVGLDGERNDLAKEFRAGALASLTASGLTPVNPADACTLTGEAVRLQTEACVAAGADAIVYLIGTWILANHVVDAVLGLDLPFAVWGVPEPASFSSVGANVLHGTLGEMGIRHKLVCGMPDDAATVGELRCFVRAAAVKKQLRRCRLGLIGGRTISAYPTAADPNQIKKLFGVEVEHIDQLVLLEKARRVPAEACAGKIAEVRARYGSVSVPDETLRRAVSVYYALREMIGEYRLDMLSVKCIGEFMDAYVSCCLALSMLNDEGFVCGCQCNLNATLSAYILTRLSGQPAFFGDVNTVVKETGTARVINCGSIPAKLAVNDKAVRIVEQYEYMGAGRGACTFFCMKPGRVTFGTLGRAEGAYVMNIATGTAYQEPEAELSRVRLWAQGFVKLDCDPMTFYRNLRCNHSVLCYGDEKDTLLELCALYGIRPETTTAP